MSYSSIADTLRDRIIAPGAAKVLPLDSPWDLFKVPGFSCSDLEPSLAQASWALRAAQAALRAASDPAVTR